jgi:hypothetical protein
MIFGLAFVWATCFSAYGIDSWITRTLNILIAMYLLHEPFHALTAYLVGTEVKTIHLDPSNNFTLFYPLLSLDQKENNYKEAAIYFAGTALDISGVFIITGICLKIMILSNDPLPMLFAALLDITAILSMMVPGSDYQICKEKLNADV